MMTEAQVGVLRDKMSAIADIALACDAKVGNCDDIEERVKIVHDHAARIALAALAICPPERQADVAAIWKAVEPESKPQYNPFMIGPFSIEHVSSKTVSVAKVKIGEHIKKGDLLLSFDLERIRKNDCCTLISVVLPEYTGTPVVPPEHWPVAAGDPLFGL